jgi:hypothetical protein
MSDITDSESLVQQPRSAGLAAPLALGIPHEVRLKLAKRMRAEQLRRYEEREKQHKLLLQESKYAAGHSAQKPDGEVKRQNARVVAFQVNDMLMDAAQNGDTDEGKTVQY